MIDHAERTWTSPDGLSLFARDYAAASGPARAPVICIHGLTRNSRDFEDVAPRIAAQGRRVLAIDVRGRGRSDRDPQPARYNVGVYAGDLIALMAQAGIARAVFVGTSMGGLITMTLAALRPDLIAASAINDVGPELAPEGLARIGGYVGGATEIKDWTDAAAYARAINGAALPNLSDAQWSAFARRIFREGEGGLTLDYDPEISQAFKAAPAGTPAPDLWPLWAALSAGRPTLLVRGAASDLMTADIAARMRLAAPHMAEAVVPGVGHAPMLDEPEAVAALDAFLADAP